VSNVRTAERFPIGDEEAGLIAAFAVPSDAVVAWNSGRRVPRRHRAALQWIAGIAQREAALAESGLPKCDWLSRVEEVMPPDETASMAREAEIAAHLKGCPLCKARDEWEEERFGRIRPPPYPLWLRLFSWIIDSPPDWARPAVIGATLLGGIAALRGVGLVLLNPSLIIQAPLAILAAAGAGAAGGLVFTATRPLLRPLGWLGDYLTGIVCVSAYMGALALAAPVAFGKPVVNGPEDMKVFAVLTVFFGLVLGHGASRDHR
jgi:hypothetical protein